MCLVLENMALSWLLLTDFAVLETTQCIVHVRQTSALKYIAALACDRSHFVAQAGRKPSILLPQPSQCSEYRRACTSNLD